MCRSRRALFNEYLLAKIGVGTAENEPLEVWGENSIQYSFVSLIITKPRSKIVITRGFRGVAEVIKNIKEDPAHVAKVREAENKLRVPRYQIHINLRVMN